MFLLLFGNCVGFTEAIERGASPGLSSLDPVGFGPLLAEVGQGTGRARTGPDPDQSGRADAIIDILFSTWHNGFKVGLTTPRYTEETSSTPSTSLAIRSPGSRVGEERHEAPR